MEENKERHYAFELYETRRNQAIGAEGHLMLFERHYNSISLKKPIVLNNVQIGITNICDCEGLDIFQLESVNKEISLKLTLVGNPYETLLSYSGMLSINGMSYSLTAISD